MGKSPAYREDVQAAKDAVYKYVNNPFIEGSRRARMFANFKRHYLMMESRFDELAAVYGDLGAKNTLIDNLPYSTQARR